MAKKPKKKGDLPQEVVDAINAMKPEDLAIEAAREQLMLERSKEMLKNDAKKLDLEEELKAHKEKLEQEPDVIEAKRKLEEVKLNHMTQDHLQAKEDLAYYVKSWRQEIKDRGKKCKLMMKTLRKHMESGALKSKVD
jgi:hypothetical protein